jgi:hypothetical protein
MFGDAYRLFFFFFIVTKKKTLREVLFTRKYIEERISMNEEIFVPTFKNRNKGNKNSQQISSVYTERRNDGTKFVHLSKKKNDLSIH